jgi:hypothetical protein
MQNSEIEDLINLSAYAPSVDREFGVNLNLPRFRNSRAKWSDRVARLFQLSGKIWNRSEKMKVKRVVVDSCIAQGISSLNNHSRAPIDSLVASLDAKIAARGT